MATSKSPASTPPASTLQRELHKKQPFAHAGVEAALNLLRTADFCQRELSRLLKGHGLSGPQYNVLRILRGHAGEGVCCQEIGKQMLTFDPDVTRLVDRLEKSRLVRRQRSKQDRRVVLVTITPRGLALLSRIDAPLTDLHQQRFSRLSARELGELNRMLVKIRDADSPPCDDS